MRLEGWHIVIVIVLAIVLFGAPRLPGMARSVGQSLRIFRSEIRQLKDEDTPNDVGTTSRGGDPLGDRRSEPSHREAPGSQAQAPRSAGAGHPTGAP